MTKTLKHFFLLFVFIFSMASAEIKEDQYRLHVTMVDPEFHCFALSNNMVFNIPKKNWETAPLPEVGTEVYIISIIRELGNRLSFKGEGEIGIKFSKNPEKNPVYVWMTKESEQYCLSYVSSEKICTVPAGWLSSAEYIHVMTLSDGSRWIKGKGESFMPGDRVIVSKCNEDEFWIVDIDRSIYLTGFVISNEAFTWQAFEKVKPYNPETTNKE